MGPDSRGSRFIDAWGRGVHWTGVAICVAFIPVMVYWSIVAPRNRWVTIPAIPLLVYLALRRMRLQQRSRPDLEGPSWVGFPR